MSRTPEGQTEGHRYLQRVDPNATPTLPTHKKFEDSEWQADTFAAEVLMPIHVVKKCPTPRFIRLKDAPAYLGMNKNRFNSDVRPLFATVRIGAHGIAFDRIDLDSCGGEHARISSHPRFRTKRKEAWAARPG